jgi:M6 family metalloprotease-like protein
MNKKIGSLVASTLALSSLVISVFADNPSANAEPLLAQYASTDPVLPPSDARLKEGLSCKSANYNWEVVGYRSDGRVGYIKCDYSRKLYVVAPGMPLVNQNTLQPLVPKAVPRKTHFGYTPQLYIRPVASGSKPKSVVSEPLKFQNLSMCRIAEIDRTLPNRPSSASGFPIPAERVPLSGKIIVQLIPVDFEGKRTRTAPSEDFRDATAGIEKFWERQSNSRADIQFRIPETYIPLPDRVLEYDLRSTFPNFDGRAYQRYVEAAVKISDPQIDFSDVDVVILAHTPKATAAEIGTFIAQAGMPGSDLVFETAEGTVLNTLIQGGDSPRDLYNWIHEFGHMLGLTDSGAVGKMGFDVMLSYFIPELTVWHRFLLDALSPGQLHCISEPGVSRHWIRPVASTGKDLKGVVIPISESFAIVVESRRRMGYDAAIGMESQGAFVYTVDTTKSGNQGSGPFQAIGPKRMTSRMQWSVDSPLKFNESVSVSGWKITNVESGVFGDVVKVEKLN